MKKLKTLTVKTAPEEFARMIEIMSLFTQASNQLAALATAVNSQSHAVVEQNRKQYTDLQALLTEAETNIKGIASKHPEWFSVRKGIKTPYGEVKFHESTVLEVENEEAAIALIEREAEIQQHAFKADDYLHTTKTLNREALEKCDDATLRRFLIKRVTKQNFSLKPATLDMGKAVEEAVDKDDQQKAA